MSSTEHFDYFVIGGGSGGVRSARVAAGHGAKVGIAESRFWGGTCVNVGCVPKKLLTMAARYSTQFADATALGWDMPSASHNWPKLIAHKDREIARLNEVYSSLLRQAGCKLFEGQAALLGAHSVSIGDQVVSAERILLATGGKPTLPPAVVKSSRLFTSDEAFHLPALPKRIIIVGAGYVAVEFAGIFQGLGSDVTFVCRGQHVLRGFDHDLCMALGDSMAASGIMMRLGHEIASFRVTEAGVSAQLDTGEWLTADAVLLAIGREPNTTGLGLEQAGVHLGPNGAVVIDGDQASSVPNIFAIGDVTDRINLTPVAIAEGHLLADRLFADGCTVLSYENVPTAVFSDPPVATVGLTEADAALRHGKVASHRSWYVPDHALMSHMQRGIFVKLVVDLHDERVLGCHMLGDDAPELLQGVVVAMNKGLSKTQFHQVFDLGMTDAAVS